MYDQLLSIYNIDRECAGRMASSTAVFEDLFITGSLFQKRPKDSVKTPAFIAEKMVNRLTPFSEKNSTFEPCAGQGGILEQLKEKKFIDVTFNEIDVEKKESLKSIFPKYSTNNEKDSLATRKRFGNVIMNPPFDLAHEFLVNAIRYWTGMNGEIVSLFPKLSLARISSYPATIISLLQCKHFSIQDISFGCDYGAKVCMIYVIK